MSAETDAAYALLGLKPGATKAQVDRAWRHLARDAHPDTSHPRTEKERVRAEKRMVQLNAAHDLLEVLLRDGAAPNSPPPATPTDAGRDTAAPRPWFQPSCLEFGSVGVADNGTALQLDLCNRIGHVRHVAPLSTSGSFWRLEDGIGGARPVRARFRVVLDIPPSLAPGIYLEALTMVVEGEELDVTILATVTAPVHPDPSPAPPSAWAPTYAGAASAATAPPVPVAPRATWTPPAGPRIRWGWVGAAAVCALVVIVIAAQQNKSASPTPAATVASSTPSSGWTLTDPQVDQNRVSLERIDCPTAGLCVAADGAGGVLTSTAPTSGVWTAALVFDNPASNIEPMQGLSCPTVSFCAATSVTFANGDQVTTTTNPIGGTSAWKVVSLVSPTAPGYALDSGISAISCPSASLCVAIDAQGDVITSTNPTGDGEAWTATLVDSAQAYYAGVTGMDAISCPMASLCVGVDYAGNVVVSTNPTGGATAWTVLHLHMGHLAAVSCPDANLCVATDEAGDVIVSTDPTGGGSAWKRVADVGGIDQLDASGVADLGVMSCSSAHQCVTASDNYMLVSDDPTGGASAWQAIDVNPNASLNAVSCPSDGLCVAVDGYGDVLTGP